MNAMEAMELACPMDEAIIEAADDALLIVGPDGKIIKSGRAATALLGQAPVGTSLWELLPAPDRLLVEQAIGDSMALAPTWVSVRLITSSGAWVPVRLTARRFRGAEGSGYVIAAASVRTGGAHEPRHDENTAALLRMVRGLFSLNHDIRSPLGAILGNAQLAQRAMGDGDPKVAEKLDRIVLLCDRVAKLLDGMTDAKQQLLHDAPELEGDLQRTFGAEE